MGKPNEVRDGLPSLMLAQTQLTHADMKKQVESIKDLVDRGAINPLDAYTKLTYLLKLAEAAKDSIKEYAINEAEKYHKQEEIKVNGAVIQLNHTSRYDYGSTGDPKWKRLDEEKSAREAFLKTIKTPIGIADEDTGGETITIHPPKKTTSDVIKISFPYGT